MSNKFDIEELACLLAEVNYIKLHDEKNKGSNKNSNNFDLFPMNWYKINNYGLKTKILAQAIEKQILIIDTPLYQEKIEGIENEEVL